MSYYVYIATNNWNTVLYTGVTNNIQRRMYEHSHGIIEGFTKRYNIHKLIWFQEFSRPDEAIIIEKRLKGWTRKKKFDLITESNPTYQDLINS